MMSKLFSRKTISTLLAALLVLSLSNATVYAAPNTNSLTTGRNELNLTTGVIKADQVPTLAHYATDVTLTGTVVIDGPKLVLLVNGQDVSSQATLTKVADKTWRYLYKTTVGSQTGDVTFNVGAYTVYMNGKTAGQVHTNAAAASQSVHVPFVKSYDYTKLEWTSYDRQNNLFTFSYNLVKVWDDGIREEVTTPVIASVNGTATYRNSGFEIVPPVVFRDFTFSAALPVWQYNETTKNYNVTFVIDKLYSNGTTESLTLTRDGLTPGVTNTVSVTIGNVTHSVDFTAPAAPAPAIPSSVAGTVAFNRSIWTGNNGNGGNVKEYYTLSYSINGETFTVSEEFTFNPGTEYKDQNITKTVTYHNVDVTVTYTLQYIEPASKDINTTN